MYNSKVNLYGTLNPIISNIPSEITIELDSDQKYLNVSWVLPIASYFSGIKSFFSNYQPSDKFYKEVTKVIYTAIDSAENTSVASFYIVLNEQKVNANIVMYNSSISCVPNPSHDWLNIKSDQLIKSVSIFDISGRNMLSDNLNDYSARLCIQNLTNGIYSVEIRTMKGQIRKLIVKK